MLQDVAEDFFSPKGLEPARGWLSDLRDQLAEAKDRSIEVAAEQLLVKAVWMQMKQNAAAAQTSNAGLALVATHLNALKQRFPNLEVHLLGHSAGAILLGHLLEEFKRKGLTAATLSLFAPACTVSFAQHHYGQAIKNHVLQPEQIYFDILSDERERADTVGPYGKSLLYLVSRALEDLHKMPILGMEGTWRDISTRPDVWHRSGLAAVREWRRFIEGKSHVRVHDKRRASISDGRGSIPLAHGSFDNDVDVMAKTLERVRGARLRTKIESLRGF